MHENDSSDTLKKLTCFFFFFSWCTISCVNWFETEPVAYVKSDSYIMDHVVKEFLVDKKGK
jgi:hypothetical protein